MGTYKDNLYIAVKCEEPQPDKIKIDPDNYRNGWYADDNLEFFFSPDKSPHGFKQFVVNSRSASWCNLTDANADKDWQAAAYTGTDYWSVEMKLPFPLLGIRSDMTTDIFLFNLARAAYSNPDNEQLSSFAPVKNGFGDVKNFSIMTFAKELPVPEKLSEAHKTPNTLDNWLCYRIWKIANVKEYSDVDRQADENVRRLMVLKQQAKALLESKDRDGMFKLARQYDKQIDDINMPKKRLVIHVQNREANARLYIDGKELAPDAAGNCTAELTEGLNVFGMKVTSVGKKSGVRLRIPGQTELESRWRVGTADNDNWLTASFDDRAWKKVDIDKQGYLCVPEGFVGDVCFRQIILWGEKHYSGLPCIQPKVREWGFSEKSMETFFHFLYSPPPLTYALEEYEFMLDVPKGFSLLKEKYANDFKGGKHNRRPQKVTEEEVKHEGQPYTRYRFAFESAFVQANNNGQLALIPLFLNEYEGADKLCKFYFRRMAAGNLTELEQILPVRILPPLNGRMPKKVMFGQYVSVPYLMWMGEANGGKLFPEHFEAYMRQSLDVGFNSWTIQPQDGSYGKMVYDRVLERGGVVAVWDPHNYPIWGHRANQSLGSLMRKVPEFRVRMYNDTERSQATSIFCRTFATGEGAVQFKEAVKKDIGGLFDGSAELKFIGFPKASIYWTDWEQKIWRETPAKNYCFCENCKKAFRQYAKLPDNMDLSDDAILKNYKVEWKSFREQAEGRVNGIVRAVCNERGVRYMLYDDAFNDGYWSAQREKIDIASPGWPGDGLAQQGNLDERMAFYRKSMGISQVNGQLFATVGPDLTKPANSWIQRSGATKDGFLDAKSVKRQILRIVAAFHGGVELGSSLSRCAGQLYYIGEATRLISEYEDLFWNGEREDQLAASEQIKYPNLLVLKKGQERLVLLFNEGTQPLRVLLENKELSPGQRATIFGVNQIVEQPGKIELTIGGEDVAAVYIQ
jgi:hypothetical protein